MRTVTLLGSVVLLCALSFGQNGRGVAGYCPYGCGPYIPLLTTPSLSFATVSPSPVGATNATGGLFAGATDSTLSEVSGDTDAVYTVPVWYSGGQLPAIRPMSPELAPANIRARQGKPRRMELEKERGEQQKAAQQAWVYFSSTQQTTAPVRSYANDDVARQNQQNGVVKYDSKTEKIQ